MGSMNNELGRIAGSLEVLAGTSRTRQPRERYPPPTTRYYPDDDDDQESEISAGKLKFKGKAAEKAAPIIAVGIVAAIIIVSVITVFGFP
jgi:hypothetical protein